MKPAVYLVGAGMTPTGKFADRTLHTLAANAVREALSDAGASPHATRNQ